jgi:hypothetical protein
VSFNNVCIDLANSAADAILQEHKLTKKAVKMNYENYKGKVIERFGITLKGWPVGAVCNPSKLHIQTNLDL